MIKSLAWNTFKNTGNINTYLELSQVIDIEKSISRADSLKNPQSLLPKQVKGDARV
ncbi:MAG: hypothetical protein FWF46_07120 [Oscillospiraceae bacterium]|nr:hypothetical protein [Oscillospiraceae bacterium]